METVSENRTGPSGAGHAAIKPAIFVSSDDVEHYKVALSHLLVALGAKSSPAALVCPASAKSKEILCPSVELVCHPLFRIPVLRMQNRMEVLDKLSKFKPAILHCFSPKKAGITAYIAEQMALPYLVSVNRPAAKYHGAFLCSDACAGIICSSNVVYEKIKSKYSKCKGPIERINTGAFAEDEPSCFKNPSQVTSMVLADELKSVSQFESLLNAVRHLAIDGFEFMLAIVGAGPAGKKIRSTIKSLGLSNIVTMVGQIKPIRTVFAGSDIFIQLDMSGYGQAYLLDAMGVGMCVASSRHNKSDLLTEDRTAVLFDPHDELDIYSALKRVLSRREFARQIAENGQQRIRRDHSVSVMTEGIIECYRAAQSRFKESKSTKQTTTDDREKTDTDQTSRP